MRALAKAQADRFGTRVEFASGLDGPAGARRNRAGLYALIAVGISLVAALAHGLRTKLLPRGDSGPAASHKMLVVLPLENLGAPEDEYFADGLSEAITTRDRKSTRLNSSHGYISYAVFCLKKKKNKTDAI